jgi:hypothetical protein
MSQPSVSFYYTLIKPRSACIFGIPLILLTNITALAEELSNLLSESLTRGPSARKGGVRLTSIFSTGAAMARNMQISDLQLMQTQ